ncbi:S1 family peptidase [Glycomyces buryatensis]|uniref:S1 family peptidase n=1 Tax=Glycomyces buryatensis TaxID=2570927 RepID=UPI0014562C2F|nr:serine protease [Glycomyces buryatensis]
MDRTKKKLIRLGAGISAGLGAAAIAWAATAANADSAEGDNDAGAMVIGGEEVAEGQYPWLVGVGANSTEGTPYENQFCGGSVITEDVVLTAAHCVVETEDPAELAVFSGSVDLESEDVVTTEVADVHVAEDYGDPSQFANDWALLKLAEPVDVEPIGLDTEAAEFETFEVAGWGLTEDDEYPALARWVEVPFVDDETCAAEDVYGAEIDAASMVCAGDFENGGIDSCSGDSGGPLMGYDEEGVLTLAGIVSWGNGCAEAGYPGVYAEVSAFTETIDEVIAGWGGGGEDPEEPEDPEDPTEPEPTDEPTEEPTEAPAN